VLERTATTLRSLLARLRRAADEDAIAPAPTRTLGEDAMRGLELEVQPFRDNATAEDLFVDDAVEMQLNVLAQHLRDGQMLPLLKGEAGSGKTSLLIQLMARTGEEFHFFVVRAVANLTAERIIVDMLRVMIRPVPEDTAQCFRQLARQLRELVADDRPAALVIDDAHLLADHELDHLLTAADSLRNALGGRFRLLLAADPGIELRLPSMSSEQLDRGQVSAANVRPLARARIGPYLEHRLEVAGFRGLPPFDDEALDRIHAAGGGLPRGVEAAAAGELNERWSDW